MPTYRVTAPDGKTYRVKAPEGATREQVLARVQSSKPKETSFWQGALEGVTKAVTNAASYAEQMPLVGAPLRVASAALDLIDGDDEKQTVAKRAQQQSEKTLERSKYKGSKAGKLVGEIAATLPLGVAGGPIAQGAVTGALLTEDPEDAGGVARDTAIGMAAGKAGDVIGRKVIAPAASRIYQTAPVKTARGAIQKAATKGATTIKDIANPRALAPLGRDAQVRAARLQAAGAKSPTLGMVTRDPRAWYFEREGAKLAGFGDDMLGQIRGVEDDLVRSARGAVDRQGGSIGKEASGQRVVDALSGKSDEMGDAVSSLYTKIRAEKGDVPVGKLSAFREFLDSPDLADDVGFDSARESLMRRLSRFGDDITVGQAEGLRKFIGRLNVPGASPAEARRVRTMLTNALDDEVVDSVGDDAFKVARDAARARFSEFKGTFAGKLADEGIAPEAMSRRLLQGGVSNKDLRALKQSLTTGTEGQVERGTKAVQAMRGQIVDDLFGTAITPDGKINAATLNRNWEKAADKLRILLEPADYKQLRRIVLASRDAMADVPGSGVNYSNTASTIANMFPGVAKEQSGGTIRDLIKRGAMHLGAFGTAGPAGNVGLMLGEQTAKQLAARKAAQEAGRQFQMASNPVAAANAVKQQELAKALQQALLPYQNISGRLVGVPAAAGAVSVFPDVP